jgi:hypothetical protein
MSTKTLDITPLSYPNKKYSNTEFVDIFLPIKNYNITTGLRMGICCTVFPFRNLQEPECSWNTISESLE